jgi:hypothetical protein
MVLKLGLFGKQIRNTGKDLKSGAGEGWTDRVRNEEGLHRVKGRGMSFLHLNEGKLTELVTFALELPSKTRY